MKIVEKPGFIQYWPQSDGVPVRNLMGFKVQKNNPWVRVEDNLVNRIVLGLPYRTAEPGDVHHCMDLTDYQVRDVSRMASMSILNANPMGLGKTVEAIRALRELNVRNALIVTPKIIRVQWRAQFERWWPQAAHRVHIMENPKEQQVKDDGSIWIVNYDKLQTESVLTKFRSFQWEVLIADEAHRIKNRKSKRTVALKNVPAHFRWPMTGTPITRYVDDLWSILHFADPRYSGSSYWNFVNYFCNVEETFWGNKITGLTENPQRVAVLQELLDYVCIRNEEVVTKGRSRDTILLPMEAEYRKLYDSIRKIALDELPESVTIANGAVLTMRLRQLCSWPGHFIDGVAGSKFEWIKDLLEDTEEKIIVFSCFEKSATALKEYLVKNGIRARTITGQNTPLDNVESKKLFLEDPHTRALIGTFGAMSEGYDGLQDVARIAIMLDRDWSPGTMDQAESRLDRMKQKLPVWVAYLEIEKSFDQYVGRINLHKTEDIRRALNDQ